MSASQPGLVVAGYFVIPDRELEETVARSGGPGGQHVNKTSTRVTLRWCVQTSEVLRPDQRERLLEKLGPRLTREGDLLVHSGATRSQLQNREAVRERLATIIAAALAKPRPRKATRPSRGAKERRLDSKRRDASRKRERRGWPE